MLDRKPISYVISIVLLGVYVLLGYHIQRHDTIVLLSCYSIIFILYCWIYTKETQHMDFWIYVAIGIRCVLLFAVPMLSEDIYRFIWDGRLLAAGHHPFAYVPSHYIENQLSIPGIDENLYLRLNSKNYFTVYPPVAQYLFLTAVKVSTSVYGSLLFLKASIVIADIGCIFLLKKLIQYFDLKQHNVLIYALNPLVILELSGNAHFESIVLFFVLITVYLLIKKKLILAALPFSISICVKLIPLIFLPAMIPLLGKKRAFQFYFAVALVCLALSMPLLDREIIYGFQHSLGYYFSRFEFNASIYYLIRALGYLFWGHNIGYIAGGLLAISTTAIIFILSLRWVPKLTPSLLRPEISAKRNVDLKLVTFNLSIVFSLFTYFSFATTIHPWYITPLLAFTALTSYRFVMVWTFTIFITYIGYSERAFQENYWVVAMEYAVVFGYLANELFAGGIIRTEKYFTFDNHAQ